MTAENKQQEKKGKTPREVFGEKIDDIEYYNTGVKKTIKSTGETGGAVVEILNKGEEFANKVLEYSWGKNPETEIKELKKEKKIPDNLDYEIFLKLKFLTVTCETGKKIKTQYGKHKFECSKIKSCVSYFFIKSSDRTSTYMINMQKPDVEKSFSPAKKARLTVEFMTGNQEMAAVLWIMNLRDLSLFEFTPEFSCYYQKAKDQGKTVAEDEASEFSNMLKGTGAVYEVVKEEETLKKIYDEANNEIAKKRIENYKQLQLKIDSEPLDREMIDIDLRKKFYKARKQEELSDEKKVRQQSYSSDSSKVITLKDDESGDVSENEDNNILNSPKFTCRT